MPKETTRVDVDALLERLAGEQAVDSTDDRILTVAGQLLVAAGLSGLEVDEVAARSGVGRSTIYRRYGDRNGLLVAALAHESRRFLTVLAEVVSADEPVEEQVVAAFCAGLRMARAGGLSDLVRTDPLLLRLLTVDGGPVIAAAREQLVALACAADPTVDVVGASRAAELLVRLAISFVLSPDSTLDLDSDGCEAVVRRHVAPLIGR